VHYCIIMCAVCSVLGISYGSFEPGLHVCVVSQSRLFHANITMARCESIMTELALKRQVR
jgi:hypothetical protein